MSIEWWLWEAASGAFLLSLVLVPAWVVRRRFLWPRRLWLRVGALLAVLLFMQVIGGYLLTRWP